MSINNTTTTGGFYGINGDLALQGRLTAKYFSYYDTNGNAQDFTNAIENAGAQLTVTNNDASATAYYLTFVPSSTTGTQSFYTSNNVTIDAKDGKMVATVLQANTLQLNKTNITFIPNSYGSLITLTTTTATNLLTGGNSGTLYQYYHLKTTASGTPTLVLPDPIAALAGVKIEFIRAGTTSTNTINLTTVTGTTSSNFLISSSATNITPTFTLGATWYKISFVCLINPNATGTPYAWNQVLYQ